MSNELVHIANLNKNYSVVKALDDVSLDLEPGHIIGLLGPNVPRYEQKTLSIT